jgi:tRNA dimethylallyltransferase
MSSSPSTPPPDVAHHPCPILIAGPTASGKSALAMALAQRLGGCVINADALQVYAEWRILTARPGPEDEAEVPHRLYGQIPAATAHSVGAWLRDLRGVLAECRAQGWRPIIAGGTGLYFKALTEGLAEIPEPDAAVRRAGEARLAEGGREALAADLAARDPATLAAIDARNPARLLRAWEVLEATGRGLAAWRAATPEPLVHPDAAVRLKLLPDRAALYARTDARLDTMVAQGVLDEVAEVMRLGLPRQAPALKAVGAPEFMAHLRGEMTLDEAVAQAKLATRHYAKRQMTWLRNQMVAWTTITAQESSKILDLATESVAQSG